MIIIACLLSVVAVFLLWMVVAVATIARSGNRARRLPPIITELARGASADELAEIDDELDRVLARER